MPAFQEVFIDKQLLETEYRELITKGYLKIKMDLSVDQLKAFSTQYKWVIK